MPEGTAIARLARQFAFGLLLACAPASASVYTFTNVLDSTQQQISTNTLCLAPSINSTGTLAFLAGSGSARGIYKGSGGALTLVADTTFGGQARLFDETSCHGPSINDAGDVAFYASVPSAALDGIYVGNGGAVATVADSSGAFAMFSAGSAMPYVMINESGDIPFVARFDLSGPEALYVGDTTGVSPLYDSGNSSWVTYENGPSINDAGNVAFFALTSNFSSDGLFVGNGGTPSQRFDRNSAWCSLSLETGINSLGSASYAGELGTNCVGDTLIYLASATGSAPLVSGPVVPFWFDPPSFNNNGGIAFNGGPLGGPNGIYTGGQNSSAVIRIGDPLFSSTVTSVQIGRQGLNDSGHVAFWYKLADGRSGYARANLIPDFDGDGLSDSLDNCPFKANPTQADIGGVGTASGPDGIGDSCQCGDVNNDGRVTGLDGTLVKRASLSLAPFAAGVGALPAPDKCDVNGGTTGDGVFHCSGLDGTLVQRASLMLPPGVQQFCPAADGS